MIMLGNPPMNQELELKNLNEIERQWRQNTTHRIKRVLDLGIASLALIISLPVWPLIALAITLESRGPIFFRQQRIGLCLPTQCRIFQMIKFRTMVQDAESRSGAVWAQKNDPRTTKTGKFLRKTRLDELPQLINVLCGDMSLVGPRPERPGFYKKLENDIPYFAERTYGILPGITGLAQVNQGYDQCLDDVRNKLRYDFCYSLALRNPLSMVKMDLLVVWKTLTVMICGRGQ